jgi:hypothetical protein
MRPSKLEQYKLSVRPANRVLAQHGSNASGRQASVGLGVPRRHSLTASCQLEPQNRVDVRSL